MTTVALDAVDGRILEALQSDCSLTNQELAAQVHTSAATCLRRVKRLIDSGVIQRRIAILAPERAGPGLHAGITAVVEVTLDRQAAELQAAFEERAVADPEVQQCYRVTPGPDFVLIAYVADTDGYQALAQRLLTSDINVRNVRTYFSIRRGKFEPRIPVTIAAT
jgi:Lrp/AsnC family transcriptional regulator, leucine-responsive regulatory protein